MDTQTLEAAAPRAQSVAPVSLEAVELELALSQRHISEQQFEMTIRETVEAVGGALLFQMKLDEEETSRWVAAVAIGAEGTREIAIIELPCDGGSVTVSAAAQSELPIAAIAPAYAGLAECWSKAA